MGDPSSTHTLDTQVQPHISTFPPWHQLWGISHTRTHIMTQKLPRFHYQRQVQGVNITEKGITSVSKQIKIGKLLNVNLNFTARGIRGSLSIPGTGLSTGMFDVIKR